MMTNIFIHKVKTTVDLQHNCSIPFSTSPAIYTQEVCRTWPHSLT